MLHSVEIVPPVTHTAVPNGRQSIRFRIAPREEAEAVTLRYVGTEGAKAGTSSRCRRCIRTRERFFNDHAIPVRSPHVSPRNAACSTGSAALKPISQETIPLLKLGSV